MLTVIPKSLKIIWTLKNDALCFTGSHNLVEDKATLKLLQQKNNFDCR